jgi:hypothetical protein
MKQCILISVMLAFESAWVQNAVSGLLRLSDELVAGLCRETSCFYLMCNVTYRRCLYSQRVIAHACLTCLNPTASPDLKDKSNRVWLRALLWLTHLHQLLQRLKHSHYSLLLCR